MDGFNTACWLRRPVLPYRLTRAALFRLPPKQAQRIGDAYLEATGATAAGRAILARHAFSDDRLQVNTLGDAFANPLGVAGGVDKNARLHRGLHALGFGHVEIGTVTPKPQTPNPGTILWRAPAQEGLVNAMGFPNDGADAVEQRLGHAGGPLGINVGPNRDALDRLDEQMAATLPRLAPHGAYAVINLSSPNTKGLRDLAEPAGIAKHVGHALAVMDDASCSRPLLVKVSPDVADEDLVAQCHAAVDAGASGVIATNTTISRPPELEHLAKGGLSGAPLRDRAQRCVALARQGAGDEATVIGVGGIFTGKDAADRLAGGADLVQAYTGFVYRGPGFAGLVCRELVQELDARGVDAVNEL